MSIDFDIAVIGAGVVGLATARALAKKNKKVIVLEANSNLGEETSSRNSGVIHAGIYYEKDSLKAKTCLRGKSCYTNISLYIRFPTKNSVNTLLQISLSQKN